MLGVLWPVVHITQHPEPICPAAANTSSNSRLGDVCQSQLWPMGNSHTLSFNQYQSIFNTDVPRIPRYSIHTKLTQFPWQYYCFNSLRISAISLKIGGMIHSMMKQIAIRNGHARLIFARSMELWNFQKMLLSWRAEGAVVLWMSC